MRAINYLTFDEQINTYFKCNKVLQLSDQHNFQVSNYTFQLLHFNDDDEIESKFTYL